MNIGPILTGVIIVAKRAAFSRGRESLTSVITARVVGEILPDNREPQRLCEKLGFRLEHSIADAVDRATIDLVS